MFSLKSLFSFVLLALCLVGRVAAQTVTWTAQPSPAVAAGEVGGSAEVSFTARTPMTGAALTVLAQKAGGINVSSRFTIVSQSVATVGVFTEGVCTLRISDLTIADGGAYFFQIGVNGATATPQSAAWVLTVTPVQPPIITAHPSNMSVAAGTTAVFRITATGSGLTYQWFKDLLAIPGATTSTLTLGNAQAADQGAYTVLISNAAGTLSSFPATLTVVPQAAPAITAHPQGRTVVAGESVTFSVTATGTPAPTYVWRHNGAILPGATSASLALGVVTAANAGNYTVTVSNSAGTVTSNVATLVVQAAANPGRLINLSILATLAGSNDNLIMGFVIGGAGTLGSKPVVVRAAGPSLAPIGVPNVLPDPALELYAGAARFSGNDNWGGTTALVDAFAGVGAFGYINAESRDAALVATLPSGANSAVVTGNGGTGTAIAELYDATPAAGFAATTPRLVNVSVRKHIGSGLTAGFVIGGLSPATVLIRAIGPSLAQFGVTDLLADPKLTVYSSGVSVQGNDNWGNTPQLITAFTQVGAFSLPADSRDAAIVLLLQPGMYTAEVTGVGATTGVALVEIYEVR